MLGADDDRVPGTGAATAVFRINELRVPIVGRILRTVKSRSRSLVAAARFGACAIHRFHPTSRQVGSVQTPGVAPRS
jgi:hypothetical protein